MAAANAGDIIALGRAADMLAEAGRPEEAITFYQQEAEAYQQAAGADDPLARHALLMAQRTEEAITWQRSRANATRALHEAFELMRKGRPTEGPGMFRVRAIFVLLTAEWMLEKAGRPEEAITWLLSRGKAGDDRASEAVFEMLEKARRTEKAIAFHLQATEVGDPSTGAIILCQAAEAGDPSALEAAAWMLEDAGRIEEAARLRLYGLEPGGRIADPWEAPAPT